MIIENSKYSHEFFCNKDFYVFAIGYEQRSFYLYDQLATYLNPTNTLIIAFDDYEKYPHTKQKVVELKNAKFSIIIKSYSDSIGVQNLIAERLTTLVSEKPEIAVHIDYSSMPRSWYCKLPIILQSILRTKDRVYFWYSEGEYPDSYEEYPSAGIDSFSFFSGKPALQIDNNRIHILALGFDTIRTQAIISITDPDYLIACYAYSSHRKIFLENVQKVNEHVFSRAAMTIAFHLDDFSFMVSKLRETTNELLPTGNIILIPDGPKPLIFAISLIPDLVVQDGVTCLHISRNSKHFHAIDVTPTGTIYGFSVRSE